MIGGVGPESTIDYYKNIITMYRERRPDGTYPQFIINSINLQKGIGFMEVGNLAGMAEFLLNEIQKLPPAGAQFGIIAANTPHIVFEQVEAKSPIPLISIVEAICDYAKERQLKRLRFSERATPCRPIFIRKFSNVKTSISSCPRRKIRITFTKSILLSLCREIFCPKRALACSGLSIE